MKKSSKILIIVVFTIGFGSLVKAQNASISANATVISEITVAKVADLNLGTVVVGQIKSIDGLSRKVSTGPDLGSSNMGQFTVAAQAGTDVILTFSLPTELSGPNMTTLPIKFSWDDNGSVAQSVWIQADVFYWLGLNPTLGPLSFPAGFPSFQAIPGTNSVNVFIGAQVDATSATAGTYIGTITLSASYN